MAKITLEEQPDFALFPVDTILNLTVKECVLRDVEGRNGTWQKLEITFEVDGIQATGDGSTPSSYDSAIGSKIWGSVPFRLTDSAENKLRLWSEAILGRELGLGFELDTDYFVGRKVRGVTTQYNKRATNPATGQPFKGHQIDSLLPVAGVQAQPKAEPEMQPAAAAGWGGQQQSGWEEAPF